MASASQILAIYSALAGKSVAVDDSTAYGDITPPVWNLTALPGSVEPHSETVESAQCPCRLLLPLGVVGTKGEGRDHRFIALGSTTKIGWQLVDLLLWRPVEEGLGLETSAADLVTYIANYIKMVRENRSLGLGQVEIVGQNFEMDAFEYPPQSDTWFWGVLVTLTINETLSG